MDMDQHSHRFQLDYHVTLLFKPFEIHTKGGLVLACFLVLLVTVLYDGLRTLRSKLFYKSKEIQIRNAVFNIPNVLQTCIYLLEFVLGYMLMLTVMTFNTWLFISVVIGAIIGFQISTFFNQLSRLQKATSRNETVTKLSKEDKINNIEKQQKEVSVGQHITGNDEHIPMMMQKVSENFG